MKKRVWALALACVAVCSLLVMAGCTSDKETYKPEGKSPVVAVPAIGQDGVLRVGVNTANSPLAGTVDSRIVGMDVDIAAALADELGLKVSIVDVGSDAEAALVDGTVDVVLGVDKSDASALLWKSATYLSTSVALFATSSDAAVPTLTSGSTFAAQVSSKSAWAIMNEFGEDSLKSTNDLKSALELLVNGDVQYVAADALIGTYAAYSRDMNVHIVALLQVAGGYCVATLDTNSELKNAVSEAVSTLGSNGVINLIQKKWLGGTLDLSNTELTAGAAAMAGFGATVEEETEEAEEAEGEAAGDSESTEE